ncbi:PLP-dependent aminotransferase family protein [Janthinobacterium sp. 17J80-10]|uniref:aminotransferase-like domain-containing protein n=1 Tax=Janthinobacterium sp. 17J80-10 TaxID=2497863 RepID=UPI0010055B0C|nr:PLP-dependent aminotransferase family protein [Janthinobacterium sp. 17J80-10]QAU34538.1 PLP-dependent aminotransferase family protein [Janthinobacterium sp. 17J80-10]
MKTKGKTLVASISDSIERQIVEGAIRPGDRLPSIRQYAVMHHHSINTVVSAFEVLASKGLIKPKRGSGYYAVERTIPDAEDESNSLERAMDIVWLMREQVRPIATHLPSGDGFPPVEWLIENKLSRYQQRLDRAGRNYLYRYGSRHGYLPLRQHIVQKLAHLRIDASPGQIVLTHGANMALNAVIHYFLKAGDAALVDDPGYYPLFGKLKLHGARVGGVPRQADGPDVAVLEERIKATNARLFFTQSVGHNPTGSDISPAKAHRILQLAEKYNLVIVESDPLADFHKPSATRISALDQLSRTIYIGTFSKSLAPALRVGFLACSPDLANDLADVKMLMHVSTSEYCERLVDAVLADGQFLRYAVRLQERVRQANGAAGEFLKSNRAEIFCESPQSLFIWARFPGIDNASDLARAMLKRNVALAPGAIFSVDGQASSAWCRFNVGHVLNPRFQEAFVPEIQQLAGAGK